jgi:hypothetical protein
MHVEPSVTALLVFLTESSMRRGLLLSALLACVLASSIAPADEGMWLYNAFPKDRVKAKYGFEPSQEWLDHLRLSSVRFNNGGSGSFVSPDGLTFTNHHVGAACVEELSTGGKDFMKTGFLARTRAQEVKCPDLELNQLVGIEDVTAKVNTAVKPEMSTAEAGQAQRGAMSGIEKDCATATGLRCDVVTLYSGEVYHLYKYKKYTDVRLVFAPEFEAAFFGGDPDNFTYPRYDLDVTFFRVYEDGKPAHTDHYLPWSHTGVKDGELVFVSGHPGSTGRLRTLAQLEFLRNVDYPARLASYKRRIAALKKFSVDAAENTRIAKEDIFGYENSVKAITGYLGGLNDAQLMAKRAEEEAKLKEAVASNAERKAEIGDPWGEIAKAMQTYNENYLILSYIERQRGFDSKLARIARDLVRVAAEKTKPNDQRLREYRDSNLASLEQRLFSTAPIYKALEVATLTDSLTQMDEELSSDTESVMKVLNFKTGQEVAEELIDGTKLQDVAVRKQLYEGGEAAIQASTDPLIVMMREIDPDARDVRKRYDDQVDAVERRAGAKIARARFSASGFTEPPDATFTLRLSYGAVKGYAENGKNIPAFTTMGGAFEHAAAHGNKPPYQLPASWMKSKAKLNLATPLNLVSTVDIIGGNSGSPTVNKAGELVGIIFDGNIQSLPWNFAYSDQVARAVSVDSRGIQEALRKIYGATALADELMGGSPPASASEHKMQGGKQAESRQAAPMSH